MEHEAYTQLLIDTSKGKKKSFTAPISASSLDPEEKLFPLKSQAAIVFSKCNNMFYWRKLEVASNSQLRLYDNIIYR